MRALLFMSTRTPSVGAPDPPFPRSGLVAAFAVTSWSLSWNPTTSSGGRVAIQGPSKMLNEGALLELANPLAALLLLSRLELQRG